jgi:hypothetical protein
VQTLVEIRGMELERRGKLSRYGPLAVLELVKWVAYDDLLAGAVASMAA